MAHMLGWEARKVTARRALPAHLVALDVRLERLTNGLVVNRVPSSPPVPAPRVSHEALQQGGRHLQRLRRYLPAADAARVQGFLPPATRKR
jgi:hypothetical protein